MKNLKYEKKNLHKKGVWHLGKRQTGGGVPTAGPLLASVAGSVAQPIIGKIVKKYLVDIEEEKEEDVDIKLLINKIIFK